MNELLGEIFGPLANVYIIVFFWDRVSGLSSVWLQKSMLSCKLIMNLGGNIIFC